MLGNMRIKAKVTLIIVIMVASSLAAGISASMIISSIKVNGPIYQAIVQNKDLIADILPPPAYIIESYLTLFELAGETSPARRDELVAYTKKLQNMYQERHTFWQGALPEGRLAKALLATSYEPAKDFYRTMNDAFLPALRDGKPAALQELLYGPLKDAYQRHLRGIEETVSLAEQSIKATEAAATDALDRGMILLVSVFVLSTGLAVLLVWVVLSSINKAIAGNMEFARSVASGKLDSTLAVTRGDELGVLANALRAMVGALRGKIDEATATSAEATRQAALAQEAMTEAERSGKQAEAARERILHAAGEMQRVVEIVTSASEELSAQVEQARRGAENQSHRVGETAAAMEEMNVAVLTVAQNASSSAGRTDQARAKAREGAAIVGKVIACVENAREQSRAVTEDMATLGNRAESIGQVMEVISDIADQTNLLALNAAIEAARAGEAGRGFAVVADEVRKLAEKTMTATKEVGQAIRGIQEGTRDNIDNVKQAVRTIEEASTLAITSGEVLQTIVSLVENASDEVGAIAASAQQQSATSEQIHHSVEEINTISTETFRAMSQAAQAVHELAQQSHTLRSLMSGMTG